jgi:hypothetical protein
MIFSFTARRSQQWRFRGPAKPLPQHSHHFGFEVFRIALKTAVTVLGLGNTALLQFGAHCSANNRKQLCGENALARWGLLVPVHNTKKMQSLPPHWTTSRLRQAHCPAPCSSVNPLENGRLCPGE